MTISFSKNQKGSTVIEVLIATTIVAFALTALAMLMTNNVKNSAEADYREAAAGIAQDTMEKIRYRKTTGAWKTFIDTGLNNPIGTQTTGCNSTLPKYNTSFWIYCTQTDGASPVNDTLISVEVCWPKSTGPTCSGSQFSTKVTQRFYNN